MVRECIQRITQSSKNLYNNTDTGVMSALLLFLFTIAALYVILLILIMIINSKVDSAPIALGVTIVEAWIFISVVISIGITYSSVRVSTITTYSRIIMAIIGCCLIRLIIIGFYFIIASCFTISSTTSNIVILCTHFGVYVLALFALILSSLVYICNRICVTPDTYTDSYNTPILSQTSKHPTYENATVMV